MVIVVQQYVENDTCNRQIPKNNTPVVDGFATCQDDAFTFVTPAPQLKEQVCIFRRDRQVPTSSMINSRGLLSIVIFSFSSDFFLGFATSNDDREQQKKHIRYCQIALFNGFAYIKRRI